MFVAVYEWEIVAGMDDQFRAAWRRGTELITARYGSFGSRLHRTEDGRYVGVAEWPDRATWKNGFDQKMNYDEPATRQAFLEATRTGRLLLAMEVTDDLLTMRQRE